LGIELTSNFSQQASLPLDERILFTNIDARNDLASIRRYAGLKCWVISEEKMYTLLNDLVTWKLDENLNTSDLGDVELTNPQDGDQLVFAGGKWVNFTPAGGGLVVLSGLGPPSMLKNPPSSSFQMYYDFADLVKGFVHLWIYSNSLGKWYPTRTYYVTKHFSENIDIEEIITKLRLRNIDENIDVFEDIERLRLRYISENIEIAESFTKSLLRNIYENIDVFEDFTIQKLRNIDEYVDISEFFIKLRIRTINETINISESFVLLIISGAQEINGSAINGVAI